jgi:conjugative relaxase-like TrwC/TraI family protein
MPIASMTALGSGASSVGQAVANIIDYLEGNAQQRKELVDGDVVVDAPIDGDALVDYYADSPRVDSPGWWSGRGVKGLQLEGPVDPAVLARVLLGQHPETGEQLVAAVGSAGRARASADLTMGQTAEELGIHHRTVAKLAAAGTQRSELLADGKDVSHIEHWLEGVKVGRQWRFPASEIEREQAAGLGTRAGKAGVDPDALSVNQVAEEMGVTPRAVRKMAKAGVDRAELLAEGGDVSNIRQWLDGTKTGREWTFTRDEVDRAAGKRTEPRVVVAIDFTTSYEKSISLLWVNAAPEQRTIIEDAIKAGVQAGVSHLEDHGLAIRQGRGAVAADGVWAASYLHLTNRSLEPQLHVHTVIANVAAADETTQAIDARGLYREATTAGYLAGAETRAILTERLGVGWDRGHKGTMEAAGVPQAAIDAMSTRRAEVMALADELGYDSPKARQIAALSTRARKQNPEDFDSLVESWRDLTAQNGFGLDDAAVIMHLEKRGPSVSSENAMTKHVEGVSDSAVYATVDPETVRRGPTRLEDRPGAPGAVDGLSANETASLFAWLGSAEGLTKSSGVFGRSDIIESIITWDMDHGSGSRLRADTIQNVADQIMSGANIGRTFTDHVVAITVPGDVYARSGGVTWCTTESMLAIEKEVIDAYTNGRGTITGVDPTITTAAIDTWQNGTGKTLGVDQAAMVRDITSGTDRIALVVGPAGTGKTASLEVACRAWETAELKPFGIAVTGSAADTLAASTGIETSTVASLLARDGGGFSTGLGPNSVLIVDEASLLSNRDHLRLVQIVETSGARMVAIGDPAQHGAVEAGGLWSHLVASAGDAVSVLEVNRRQSAPHMSEVRLANDEIRRGEITAAFARLQSDDRMVTAPTSEQLFDKLAADWYVDLVGQRANPIGAPSAMMAANHSVRRELIERAQVLLLADGTLTGEGVRLGESTFHVGDRVITRVQHDTHRFDDRTKLRNGTLGTITDIHALGDGRSELSVNFDGKGTVRLHHDFLTQQVGPGLRGGLVPEYARTTNTAQGQTMDAGRVVGSEGTSREAIYVGLTRGKSDAKIYVVDRSSLSNEIPDVGLPTIKDERSTTERMIASMQRTPLSEVATQLDPQAQVVAVASRTDLGVLRAAAPTDPVAAQGLRVAADRIAIQTMINPPAEITERIGLRPPATDPARPGWDRAVTDTGRYWARHLDGPIDDFFEPEAATGAPVEYTRARTSFAIAETNFLRGHDTVTLATKAQTDPSTPQSVLAGNVLDQRAAVVATKPAPYITALLPEPVNAKEAAAYSRTAETIERYRHRAGLDPTSTWKAPNKEPVGNNRDRAIGPRPTAGTGVDQWEKAARNINQYRELTTKRPVNEPVKVTPPPVQQIQPARTLR